MTTKTKDPMPVRALAPWFGAGRMIAERVGRELEGCTWVGIPFAGGMSEVACINARSIAVNDLHSHVINLATIVADDSWRRELMRRLRRMPFHPGVLKQAQKICAEQSPQQWHDLDLAVAYFICCWMGRNGDSGTDKEFSTSFSMRWNANGGDSVTRYRNAIRGLAEWGRIMRRCSFTCIDAFEFLNKCPDTAETGIYVDAPWPDDGAKYKHKFSENDQRRLAKRLAEFQLARVVIRFGDHPLIRELYDDRVWTWVPVEGRTQTNATKREVLILNGMSRAEGRLFQ